MALKHFFQLICFLWLIRPLAATPTLAKPGCKDTCGNVTIPYPFGIGSGCSINEWFEVFCHENRSYLNKSYGQPLEVEVLDVSLEEQRIRKNSNNTHIHVCGEKSIRLAGNLSGSPFFYDLNKVILFGCGTVTLFKDARILGACTAACGQSATTILYNDYCKGDKCCEIPIPSTAQDFYLNFSGSDTGNNSCSSIIFGYGLGFLGLYPSYASEILRGQHAVELRWWMPEEMFPDLQNNSNCSPSQDYKGYQCSCGCRTGNPYLPYGCQGPYWCYDGKSSSRKKIILLAVGGTILGILFLVAASVFSYKRIHRRRDRKLRQKFFKRNGGLLLQQQMSIDQNIVEKVKLFTAVELGKATDNFNENRILGHGGQGTVYKGMLVDGKIVAVKKSILTDENQVEQFINEVVVLSQINHRNVVKLLGCCLETEVPLLVYEFIPNGTLYNLIHHIESYDEFLMSWDIRLKIATEIAGALAYLHSATSVPVYHRDIKSSNILLDEKYIAKLSDFGTSRHITIDQTHLTTLVKGTFSYLDPEYF